MKMINQAMRYTLLCTIATLLFISGTYAQPAGTTKFILTLKSTIYQLYGRVINFCCLA